MRTFIALLSAIALAIVPAALLSEAQAASRYSVSLHVSKTEIAHGTSVVFSGKVSPAAKGSTVSIQYFDVDQGGNRWRTIDHATVKSDGTYARSIVARDGSTSYRVFKFAGSGLSSGASPSVLIRAYSWQTMYFSDLIRYGEQYVDQYGPQTVAGVPVEHYWATTSTAAGASRWSTTGTCKRLRADVGLDDRSDAGADSQFRIHADADVVYSLRVKKGTIVPVDLPLDRANTISVKFSAEARNDLVPVYVVAANPRMYCAFPEDD